MHGKSKGSSKVMHIAGVKMSTVMLFLARKWSWSSTKWGQWAVPCLHC